MATTKITSPDLFELQTLDSALQLPSGTTAERPSSATSGEWRFNTDTNEIEFYDGSAWYSIAPASSGGGGGFSVVNQSYAQWVLLDAERPGVFYSYYDDFTDIANYTDLNYSGDIFSSGFIGMASAYNGTCWIVLASNGTNTEVVRSFTGVDWEVITTISGANIGASSVLKWNGYAWAFGTNTTTGLFYNTNADASGSWTSVSSAGARGNIVENYNNTQWLRNIDYDNLQVSAGTLPTSFTTIYNPTSDDITGISVVNGGTNFLTLYRGRPSAGSNVGSELREWTSPTGSGTLVLARASFGVGQGILNTAAGTLAGWNSQNAGDEFLTYDGSSTTTQAQTVYGFDSGTQGKVGGSYNGTSTAFTQLGTGKIVSWRSGNDVLSNSGWTGRNFFSSSNAYATITINANEVKSSSLAEAPFTITPNSDKQTVSGTMDFVVQAGGGAGCSGKQSSPYSTGSGGGAGAMLTSYGLVSGGGRKPLPAVSLGAGTYTITVGSGGAGGVNSSGTTQANNGTESSITGPNTSTYKTSYSYLTGDIATGGGGGGATDGDFSGKFGGCLGGLSRSVVGLTNNGEFQSNGGFAGGFAQQNVVGIPGGSGGGGIGSPGVPAAVTGGNSRDKAVAGRGGDGLFTMITGSLLGIGGGGGGASDFSGYDYGPLQNTYAGYGGGGGDASGGNAGSGTVNTGGGGGGGKYQSQPGGSGASGVVILRIKTSEYSGTTTGSPTVTTVGDDTVLKYTGSGTYVHS
jgi:hypothetical protein